MRRYDLGHYVTGELGVYYGYWPIRLGSRRRGRHESHIASAQMTRRRTGHLARPNLYGATAEIAERISQALRQAGLQVDVCDEMSSDPCNPCDL